MSESSPDVLAALADILEQRKHADPEQSYVASLFAKGQNKILQKVGEEAVETILAATAGEREQIVYETADLWFHTLIMLAQHNIPPNAILQELQRRFGTSGIAEKASREK